MSPDRTTAESGPAAENDVPTPYAAYLRTEVLHTLQERVSEAPAEMAFLVNVQVMELYFGLIVHELRGVQRDLRENRLVEANQGLYRTVTHFRALNGTWTSLSWMTPDDFAPIKTGITESFGRSTSLQSWMYRHLVFLLGIKSADALEPLDSMPGRQRRLRAALAEPSVYDDVLAVLHRRGLPVPATHLRRDLTEPYTPHPDVEQAWLRVYADRDPGNELYRLGELLADIADEFTTWKYRHLMSVRRTVGDRPGFYGTSGTAWLAPNLDELPYPELWSARSTLG